MQSPHDAMFTFKLFAKNMLKSPVGINARKSPKKRPIISCGTTSLISALKTELAMMVAKPKSAQNTPSVTRITG